MRASGQARGLRIALLLGLLCALSLPVLAKEDFQIRQVQIRQDQGAYLLSATVDFDFSEEALEALDNGVPLTVVVHLQVRRSNAWVWASSLLDQQLRYAIRYRPLSERYEVYSLPGANGRDFVTRDAAIRALGELTNLPLVSTRKLDPDQTYEVQLKVDLDIEELPLPLRPMAYLKPSWKLSSGWSKWPLKP
jgi:hypothetical protein